MTTSAASGTGQRHRTQAEMRAILNQWDKGDLAPLSQEQQVRPPDGHLPAYACRAVPSCSRCDALPPVRPPSAAQRTGGLRCALLRDNRRVPCAAFQPGSCHTVYAPCLEYERPTARAPKGLRIRVYLNHLRLPSPTICCCGVFLFVWVRGSMVTTLELLDGHGSPRTRPCTARPCE